MEKRKSKPAASEVALGYPRMLLFGDFLAWVFALSFAAYARYEFEIGSVNWLGILTAGFGFGVLGTIWGLFSRLYSNRFVPGSAEELVGLLRMATGVGFIGGSTVFGIGNFWEIPRSSGIVGALLFILLAGGTRFVLRLLRIRSKITNGNGQRALIYGAGSAAEHLIPQLLDDYASPYFPVALIDDAPERSYRNISGIRTLGGRGDLSDIVRRYQIQAIIVAIPSANSDFLAELHNQCAELEIDVVVLPTLREYLAGLNGVDSLRDISIEDLIGRVTVEFESPISSELVGDRRVLITGGAGSIGSELAQQISDLGPKSLVLADRDETALLSLSMGLSTRGSGRVHRTYLVDIRDRDAVGVLFESESPEIVFHAAALKHVPILEAFPDEAWKTNVQGTLNVLEASRDAGVSVFANISTDKAANAESILGKSKKLGEELTAWFGETLDKPYVSVRFGNVLGSRGSLIPIVAQQIAAGGPVTVTDPSATRYFMSIPEACQLVLQAAARGHSGDVMVLDMGEPVNINSLVEKMIRISGKKVRIEYSGLRPGEKLHEDLVAGSEKIATSGHPKILRIRSNAVSPATVLGNPWF